MKVKSINPIFSSNCVLKDTFSQNKQTIQKQTTFNNTKGTLSIPTNIALAQRANVSFKNDYYGSNMSAYAGHDSSKPIPPIEIEKYELSSKIGLLIHDGKLLEALLCKVSLASICKSQRKERDAFLLEESIRRLYKDIPYDHKRIAKERIRAYNKDMAKYIDEDIKKIPD